MRWRPFGPSGPSWWELTVQALSSTDGGYDRLAPRFDATPFRTPDPIVRRALDGVERVPAAIDLCCGTGAALGVLAGNADRVVGIDRSAGMLEQARHRLPNAELLQGDALAPPPELEGAFDVATCFGAFGHIRPTDEPTFVAATHRLLRPGGRFVFATTDPSQGRFVGRAMARAFNGVMHVRNALWRPPFIMFYLTFELPRARALLQAAGFDVEADHPFEPPFDRLVRVVATKR
ncbi:MAG: class I SAM-dependent methyltransferase [Deltaproteobacteria bacterium]|nr:class I SAM-dependent methyltransferase [Deltaproteobacteria bacterium]